MFLFALYIYAFSFISNYQQFWGYCKPISAITWNSINGIRIWYVLNSSKFKNIQKKRSSSISESFNSNKYQLTKTATAKQDVYKQSNGTIMMIESKVTPCITFFHWYHKLTPSWASEGAFPQGGNSVFFHREPKDLIWSW